MRLQDVPAFADIGKLSERLGVELTLFGGAATRSWIFSLENPHHEFDLFDITPFAADIDIAHNASADRTNEIGVAIRETLPFAAWCRFSILDFDAAMRAAKNHAMSTDVPLRKLFLSTGQDYTLPGDVREDIKHGLVRCERNPAYKDSEYAQKGRDVELFGLLLALNTQADLVDIRGYGKVVPPDNWLMSGDATNDIHAIRANKLLINRLWMKLANYRARAGHDADPVYNDLVGQLYKFDTFDQLNEDTTKVFFGDAPITISRPTSAGDFRVQELSPEVISGRNTKTALNDIYQRTRLADFFQSPEPVIDPAFELIGFVPQINVRDKPPSSTDNEVKVDKVDDVFGSWADEEFLHLAWSENHSPMSNLNPDGITACLMPWSPEPDFGLPSGVAVGGILHGGKKWVRVDLRDVIRSSKNAGVNQASLLILQSRMGSEN